MLTNLVDKKVINRPSYETIQTMTQRINWIDWAKVFAIYLVILGHHISKDVEGESLVKILYMLSTCLSFSSSLGIYLKNRRAYCIF